MRNVNAVLGDITFFRVCLQNDFYIEPFFNEKVLVTQHRSVLNSY